jgi:hypothetical protein
VSEEKKLFCTNLRLNLDKAEHRQAYEHLKKMNKRKFSSYSDLLVTALNDYMERTENIKADPYLETREKEDAFLQKVLETVQNGMANASQPLVYGNLLSLLQANAQQQSPSPSLSHEAEEDEIDEESLDAALAFADSF